jgi:hypothetical protein
MYHSASSVMLNAVVGGVAGAITGGVSGWAQYEYFRTQDEAAQAPRSSKTKGCWVSPCRRVKASR